MKTRLFRAPALPLILFACGLAAASAARITAGGQAPAGDIRAAVVLGNGNTVPDEPTPMQTARCLKALELYKTGAATKLVVTGGFTFDYISEARLMKIALVTWGVAPDDVVEDQMAATTIENGLFSARIFEERAWPKTAKLVTQKFHMERSVGIYKGVGFQVQEEVAADAPNWAEDLKQFPDMKPEALPKADASATLVVYEPFSALGPMPWPTSALARRLRVAAGLYHAKVAPAFVLYSDPYTRGPYTPAQVMKVGLVSLGVPPAGLKVVGRREFRRLADLAASLGDKSVTVVAPATAKAALAREATARWRTVFVD
jgi:vancomycin permeability regulator SanA